MPADTWDSVNADGIQFTALRPIAMRYKNQTVYTHGYIARDPATGAKARSEVPALAAAALLGIRAWHATYRLHRAATLRGRPLTDAEMVALFPVHRPGSFVTGIF